MQLTGDAKDEIGGTCSHPEERDALWVPSITPMRMWQACFFRVSFSAFVMMVLPYEPQNSCAQKSLSSAPRRQDCRSALFFNFILSILCKKVKLLPAKCTAPGKFFCKKTDFCLFCRHPAPLDRGKPVCYTFDYCSGRKPGTGGQQPAASPASNIFLKQTPRRGLPLAWNAGAGSFLFCG